MFAIALMVLAREPQVRSVRGDSISSGGGGGGQMRLIQVDRARGNPTVDGPRPSSSNRPLVARWAHYSVPVPPNLAACPCYRGTANLTCAKAGHSLPVQDQLASLAIN